MIEAETGLQNHCVTVRNTPLSANSKLETREKTEIAVQDAWDRLDKSKLAENEDEMTEVVNFTPQKRVRNRTMELHVASSDSGSCSKSTGSIHRESDGHASSTSGAVQMNVETTRKQSPNKVVDVSMNVANPSATVEVALKVVEVARVIPHESMLKLAGGGLSVRERAKRFEIEWGANHMATVEGLRTSHGERQKERLVSDVEQDTCASADQSQSDGPGNEDCGRRDRTKGRAVASW